MRRSGIEFNLPARFSHVPGNLIADPRSAFLGRHAYGGRSSILRKRGLGIIAVVDWIVYAYGWESGTENAWSSLGNRRVSLMFWITGDTPRRWRRYAAEGRA